MSLFKKCALSMFKKVQKEDKWFELSEKGAHSAGIGSLYEKDENAVEFKRWLSVDKTEHRTLRSFNKEMNR